MRMNPRRIELLFQWLMILGIIALVQPWSHFLHRFSVTIILVGLVGFSVFIKVPSRPESE